MLILIGGLPGVGKTTTARAVAGRLGAAHLRVDSFETALRAAGLADVGPHGYHLALAAAATCLRAGTDVVVDGVFPVEVSRQPFDALAGEHGAVVHRVRLVCSDPAEHRRRVEERVADLPGLVVPDWAAVTGRRVEGWDEPHTVVDTAQGDPTAAVLAALPTPEAVVRAHVAAFDRGDVEAVVAGLTDDATWRTGRSDAAGSEQLRALFGGAIAGLAPRLAVRRSVARGDTVAAELAETLTVGGVTSTVPISAWYRVVGGRIAAATVYREGDAEVGGNRSPG